MNDRESPRVGEARRRTIVAATVIGLLAGLVVGTIRSPEYETSAVVSVDASAAAVVGADPASIASGPAEGPLLEQLASLSRGEEIREEILGSADVGLTAGQIEDHLSIAPGPEAGQISFTAAAATPETATALANAAAAAAIEVIGQRRRDALRSTIRRLGRELEGAAGTELEDLLSQRLEATSALGGTRGLELQSQARLPGAALAAGPFNLMLIGGLSGLLGSAFLSWVAARREDPIGPTRGEGSESEVVIERVDPEPRADESGPDRVDPARDASLRFAELRHRLPLPVAATVSDRALGLMPLAAAGPRPATGPDLAELAGLAKAVRSVPGIDLEGTVLVCGATGNAGTTTVAASIAAAAAAAGRQVLLAEADFARPALAERLALSPSPGFSDYLAGDASPPDILNTVSIDGPPGGDPAQLVVIVAGSTVKRPAKLVAGSRFGEFHEKVGRVYDLVVIDGGHLKRRSAASRLLEFADSSILCARGGATSAADADQAVSEITRVAGLPAAAVVTGRSR